MKAKILLTVIATMTISYLSLAADASDLKGSANLPSGQQIAVSSYHFDNGYEYASRIRRFHNSYTAFDFYSPVYTEVYWYTYTPNTWGVSIYDSGYDYGYFPSSGWGSAYSGSYWWGYSPYAMYDPWWDYGFGSNSRISITVNIGRPHNHYPSAMSYYGWHNSYNRPVYVVNNYYDYNYNNYYRTDYTRREASVRPHYNRQVNSGGRTNTGSYTIVNGRSGSEANRTDEVSDNRRSASTNNDGVSSRNNNSNNSNNGVRNGNPDNARGQNGREQGNNGLRVGQYRRGNATDSEGRSNNPRRVNNPNVNDRNNPGREKEDAGYRSGNRAATTTTANTTNSNTTVVSSNTGQSGTSTVNRGSNNSQNNANVQEKPGRRQTRSASQSKDESRSSNASGSGSAKQKDDSKASRRSSSGAGGK